MPLVKVAQLADVPAGTARPVTVNGKTIGLYNVAGTIHAMDDVCSHRGASLCEGDFVGQEVMCPLHGARFDVTTGQNLSPPARIGVASYRVEIVGDEIHIDVG